MLDSIPGPPVVQLVIATNLIAGVTGSASGGLAIALETFAKRYLDMGVPADVIHRVSAMSCYGLDSLPHNGSVINMIKVSGLTHQNSYKHFWWCTGCDSGFRFRCSASSSCRWASSKPVQPAGKPSQVMCGLNANCAACANSDASLRRSIGEQPVGCSPRD